MGSKIRSRVKVQFVVEVIWGHLGSDGIKWSDSVLSCFGLEFSFLKISKFHQNFTKVTGDLDFGIWRDRMGQNNFWIVWNWFKKHHKSFSKTNKQVKPNKSCCWPITIQISHFDRRLLSRLWRARLETKHIFLTVKILTSNHKVRMTSPDCHVMTSRGGII